MPERAQTQAGQGSEQVEDVPVHCREVGLGGLCKSLPKPELFQDKKVPTEFA